MCAGVAALAAVYVRWCRSTRSSAVYVRWCRNTRSCVCALVSQHAQLCMCAGVAAHAAVYVRWCRSTRGCISLCHHCVLPCPACLDAIRYSGVLLGMSNTAGVLAGVLGSLATGFILKHGSWDQVGAEVALPHVPSFLPSFLACMHVL